MEPHGQSPWFLHEIPAYDHRRCNASVRKCEGFGGLSASSESAVALTQGHRNDLATESAFINGKARACTPKCVTARRRGLLRRRINDATQKTKSGGKNLRPHVFPDL